MKLTQLPKQMMEPRSARACHQTERAWYYINPTTIDVLATPLRGNTTTVRMTRRQLQQALAIMDKHAG